MPLRPSRPVPLLLLLSLASCGERAPTPAPVATGAVPAGAVASCAGQAISAESIAATAGRLKISPREAVDRLCDDARVAAEATRRGLHETSAARVAVQAQRARAVLRQVRGDSSTEATADELAAVRADHWLEFDRPESVKVVHAVGLAMGDKPDARPLAKKFAEAVAEAVRGAPDVAAFRSRADSVAHAGLEVRIEELPPVVRDGRIVSTDGGKFDERFVEQAFRMSRPGEQTPPFESAFGWHVAMLVERAPAYRVGDDELRKVAAEELLARRANERLKQLLGLSRQQSPVAVERYAIEALGALDAARSAPK